ncbi:OLC1v1020775C1 [Oldenlandia corymbosa var. corymbosa]|nr:OLC1v1020775C1 [Oldenlandia corymbosa var. corymbosa]
MMNAGSDHLTRRKSFKLRLGFNGLCGAMWGYGPNSTMSVRGDEDAGGSDGGGAGSGSAGDYEEGRVSTAMGTGGVNLGQDFLGNRSTPACGGDAPAPSGMNLAAALAAERQFRAAQEFEGFSQSPTTRLSDVNNNQVGAATQREQGTPLRMSLMKLLEETDGCDEEMKEGAAGVDSMCCVCMGRKRGAAFIPCGHTFCRVCSRELWLNRGLCPLCNRTILEILDIF